MSFFKRLYFAFRPVDAYIKSDSAVTFFRAMRERNRSARLVFDMHKGHLVCLTSIDFITQDRGLDKPRLPKGGELQIDSTPASEGAKP